MSQLLSVRGGRRLEGEVTIQGAKNSVLPILAATLLARGQVALLGCPRLRDVDASIRILRHLGCDAHWEADALAVDTTALRRCEISDVLMREMRSSAIFLGAILARCGQADLSYPGGCELGPRPIDLHLAGLRDLGAEIREEGGFLHCRADRLRGREVVLRMPSVGATENLMLAACGAEGVTVISNAAREPEVVDLQNFLNACGARVSGAGSSAVSIEGGQDLHGCTYRVMPDRIAAATYLCAAASAGGDIYLRGAEEGHLSTVTAALREAVDGLSRESPRLAALRDRLIDGLTGLPYTRLTGDPVNRLPGTASFVFEGVEGEALLLHLDARGICASSGSACSSASLDPSHVLLAIGLPHAIAHGSLRLSLGAENTEADVDYILKEVPQVVAYLRELSPVWDRDAQKPTWEL